jgi:hypothetical protein
MLERANRLACVAFAMALLVWLAPTRAAEIDVGARTKSEERMRHDIRLLASDEFEGRGVTTKGINKAADYIAEQFERSGLKGGGKAGSFCQPFSMPGATLASTPVLTLTGPKEQVLDLKHGKQFNVLGMSHAGDISGPLVFAGYGITATDKDTTYDDYKGIDVEGKFVVVLRDAPRTDKKFPPFGGQARRDHASFTKKMQLAVKNKAAGIFFVSDADTAKDGDDLLDFAFIAHAPSPAKIPAAHLSRSVLDTMLKSSRDVTLADLERDIDKDLKPRSGSLTGWSAKFKADVKREGLAVKNVVGILEGKGPLAEETIVIGAHYDHLGFGGPSSLGSLKKQAVHHGADDNGSGTTTLIELARRFGAMKDRQGRRLVFIAFSGEEMGLLGSIHYTKNPVIPLEKTVTMINMDMVGRLRHDDSRNWRKLLTALTPSASPLTMTPLLGQMAFGISTADFVPGDRIDVYGTGTAKNFDALIEEVNKKHQFRMKKIPGGVAPSDNTSFVTKQIPVFFFFTGNHPEYHTPKDTADLINVPGMVRIADLVQDLTERLMVQEKKPEYVAVKTPGTTGRPGNIPRLGIAPGDYSGVEPGVMVGAVSPAGAAEKAGLKAGDLIVSLGGKPIKDIGTYMTVLGAHKRGTPIEVGVVRDGKTLKLKATPE